MGGGVAYGCPAALRSSAVYSAPLDPPLIDATTTSTAPRPGRAGRVVVLCRGAARSGDFATFVFDDDDRRDGAANRDRRRRGARLRRRGRLRLCGGRRAKLFVASFADDGAFDVVRVAWPTVARDDCGRGVDLPRASATRRCCGSCALASDGVTCGAADGARGARLPRRPARHARGPLPARRLDHAGFERSLRHALDARA